MIQGRLKPPVDFRQSWLLAAQTGWQNIPNPSQQEILLIRSVTLYQITWSNNLLAYQNIKEFLPVWFYTGEGK